MCHISVDVLCRHYCVVHLSVNHCNTATLFARKVALLSARQIHAAQQEIKDLTEAKRRSYSALLSMQTQVKQANSAVKDTLCDINSTITRLKDEVVKELCLKFKQRALTEREAIQAESKCQRGDELEELALQHENQVKHVSLFDN